MRARAFFTVLGSLLVSSAVVAGSAMAADFTIDADHSTVGFKIRHLAISSVSGRFTKFNGEFSFDPQSVATSKVSATIDVGSINTEQVKRDDHLRSPDFFDTKKFNQISFVSKAIEPVSPTEFKAKGDLTIRGVTKPVVLNVTYGGSATDHFGNERAAFVATTKLDRRDFGLTWNKVLDAGGLVVGDEVQVVIEIEGVKKKTV